MPGKRLANKSSAGTIFKITPSGQLTTLYSFCGQINCPDGQNPSAGLVQGIDGNLYGTTAYGGGNGCRGGCGTVFISVGLHPFVETLPTSGQVGTMVSILGNQSDWRKPRQLQWRTGEVHGGLDLGT